MKTRSISILIALILVVTFSLIAAVPAIAAATYTVDDNWQVGVPPYVEDTDGDNDFATIQAAIDKALSGDIINVLAGTYKEKITLKYGVQVLGAGASVTTIDGGKNSTVVTASGITSTTVLDGFTIANGKGTSGSTGKSGGGMYNKDSSPTVTDCTFSGNSADDFGGGMCNDNSSPIVTDCTFSDNSAKSGGGLYNMYSSSPIVNNCYFIGNKADPGFGGGVVNDSNCSPTMTNCTFSSNSATLGGGGMLNEISSSPILTNCTFSGNSAHVGGGMLNENSSSPILTNCSFRGNSAKLYGGGMYNSNASPTASDCIFSDNSAGYGGGMYNILSSPKVTNCTFYNNSAEYLGGGIFNEGSSSPVVSHCKFSDNSAKNYGGGMLNINSSPTLTNCTFSGNSAESIGGGGMCNMYSSPIMTNCTLAGNSAYNGGGIYNFNYSSPMVTNCVLWGNGEEIYNYDTNSSPTVTYCDIQGGYSGEGNINQDPKFVVLDNDDFHLQPTSPCIDKGTNVAPSIPVIDFEGDLRIIDGNGDHIATADMGIDEVTGSIVLSPASATNPVGTQHTLTITAQYGNGQPMIGYMVTFTIKAGPHAGLSGTAITNESGQANWSYTGTNVGTDTVIASTELNASPAMTSKEVYKTWIKPKGIGGEITGIDKMRVLAPWLISMAASALVYIGVIVYNRKRS